MIKRHQYYLDLSGFDQRRPTMMAARLELRAAQATDAGALAELMIEAYRETVDHSPETLEEALGEVHAYLAGERGGRPILDISRLAFSGPLLVAACLAVDGRETGLPLIAYVMTRAEWKNRRVGKQVLWAVLQALYQEGHRQVRAFITAGNTPSERLFDRLGFRIVESHRS